MKTTGLVKFLICGIAAAGLTVFSGCLDNLGFEWPSDQEPVIAPNIVMRVTDIDGNEYPGVQVGNQVWFFYDLRTTRYRNGDSIGTTRPATLDITESNNPKYQWSYKGLPVEAPFYGRYYTWYAANDSRGICPSGWHVATTDDWNILINYLGGASVAGESLKSGASGWNDVSPGVQPQITLQAFPVGMRNANGEFYDYKKNGYWWTTGQGNVTTAGAFIFMLNGSKAVDMDFISKSTGMCIRCVQDGR